MNPLPLARYNAHPLKKERELKGTKKPLQRRGFFYIRSKS